jgi:PTS system sucrose-specific IIC component
LSRDLAEKIVGAVGGRPNVLQSASCMTRLRLKLADADKADIPALKAMTGVLGVIHAGEQLQIVLGPGKVQLVATEVEKLMTIAPPKAIIGQEKENKARIRQRNQTPVKQFLARLAAVFVPLIPAIVASGMVAGATNIAVRIGVDPQHVIVQMLNVVGWGLFTYLPIFVGFQTAKEFGGSPAIGGLAGVLLINPAIATIQFDGAALLPGRGGIFGVLLVAGFMAWLEQRIRRHVPQSVDIIVTPTITLLVGGLLTYTVLQPISGILSDGVVDLFRSALSMGGSIAGAVLAGCFLPLVITGLHQGLTPVHMEFLNTLRANPLLPVLAMSGAGQVGAAVAVLLKTRNNRLRGIIKGALPVGILGIGEPLIFGVTLPLGKPFITACFGAAAGGAFQAAMQVQSIAMGVSGLPLAFLIRGDQIQSYLIGLAIAYVAGFLLTWLVGFDDPPEDPTVQEEA